MKKSMRWILLPATVIAATLALTVRASARRKKAARVSHEESVRDWENEGGALATSEPAGRVPAGTPAQT